MFGKIKMVDEPRGGKELIVECYKCKCEIKKRNTKEVITYIITGHSQYYCNNCWPGYDEVMYPGTYGTSSDGPTRYFVTKRIEVDENGKQLKLNK